MANGPDAGTTALAPALIQANEVVNNCRAQSVLSGGCCRRCACAAMESEAASDDENTALRVRALLAPKQALQQAAVAQPVRSSGEALYPIFNLAARTQRS